MDKDILKELAHKLDEQFGALGLNKITIENVNLELGRISVGVENTDRRDMTAMALQFNDMAHSIQLIADLLNFTKKDLNDNMDKMEIIKESFFDIIVRENEQQKTLESGKKQG